MRLILWSRHCGCSVDMNSFNRFLLRFLQLQFCSGHQHLLQDPMKRVTRATCKPDENCCNIAPKSTSPTTKLAIAWSLTSLSESSPHFGRCHGALTCDAGLPRKEELGTTLPHSSAPGAPQQTETICVVRHLAGDEKGFLHRTGKRAQSRC